MNFLKRYVLIALLLFSFKEAPLSAIVSKLHHKNNVVLITGASRGIGLATAKYLAKEGYRVYGTLRNTNSLDTSSIKDVHFEILDVTDPLSIQKTVSQSLLPKGRSLNREDQGQLVD